MPFRCSYETAAAAAAAAAAGPAAATAGAIYRKLPTKHVFPVMAI